MEWLWAGTHVCLNSDSEAQFHVHVHQINSFWKGLSSCKMTFQLWFKNWMKLGWKIKVSVANSEEDFKNTTVEELKRKLLSEDECKSNTSVLCFYVMLHVWLCIN